MKKSFLIFLSLLLVTCVNLSGCSIRQRPASPVSSPSSKAISSSKSPSSSASTSSHHISSAYTVNKTTKPVTVDNSSSYTTSELTALNKLNNKKDVSEIYFVDNNTVIFSAKNGKTDDANSNSEYDLFKYSLKTGALTRIFSGFMLYIDDTVTVKDTSNFSIVNGIDYIKIENNKMTVKHSFISEGKKSGYSIGEAFYNEKSRKLLFTEADKSGNATGAFVSGIDFSSPQKLPFSGIYRVQWADNTHVLVAYKDSGKSLLAKYSLADKSTTLTTLPDKNYFIDPQLCDNGLIKFFYLEPQSIKMPWGFLNLKTGTVNRVLFTGANPVSLLNNNRMAAFTDTSSGKKNRLYLYDTSDNRSTIRSTVSDSPAIVAVSPSGSTIVFVSSNSSGNEKSYINKKK